MKVKTKGFGEIEVSEKQRIFFKNGILGFEDIHDFLLLDTEDGSPFYWLQAEKISEIAFVIIDPRIIVPDYKIEVDSNELEELEIKKDEDILQFSIVTIYENLQDITINLLGPVIINKTNHYAKQLINQNEEYSVKHPLLQKKEGKQC